MSLLTLDAITLPAVAECSLSVAAGASKKKLGAGGAALLAAIGGHAPLTAGRILLQGEDVTHRPAERRGTATLFGPETLFAHLTLFENVAFGLRRKGGGFGGIARRAELALDLAGLRGMGNRRPHDLDREQGWRAALARAAAPFPDALLLPEPPGFLDAAIRALRPRDGGAVLLALSEPERALALADRIAVLHGGRVVQCAAPGELWERPLNRIVAEMLGPVNILAPGDAALSAEQPAPLYALRPERLRLVAEAPAVNGGAGVVEAAEFRGDSALLTVRGVARVALRVRVPGHAVPAQGSTVCLAWEARALAPLAA